MLDKAHRLDSFALKNPKQVSANYFNFKYSVNEEDIAKFAFVVSKKTHSRATKRNEMKRKVRAGIEALLDSIKDGFSFIFYPKKETISATSTEIAEELRKVLKKENLLNV